MRIAFISDIHGNAVALDAVLADIEKRNVDQICVLGDISYRGLEPQRSLDLVRSLNTSVIKGNADEWTVRGVQKGEVPDAALEMMNREQEWIVSHLDDESIQYLKKLPTELNLSHEGVNIHAFHATPNSLFDIVLPHASDEEITDKLFTQNDAGLFIYAHIHRPYIRHINGKCIINLGSVGLPFDGNQNASYALVDIDKGSFQTSIIRVKYDVESVIKAFEQSDYPNREFMMKVLRRASIK